jgi:phosphoglucomutase
MIAEIAAWAKSQDKSLFDILMDIYQQFSCYQESLINVVRKGKSGAEEIQQMMAGFREDPPQTLGKSPVREIRDYLEQFSLNTATGKKEKIGLPKSNVLQFLLEDGSKISVRPSGTEPKIKFYFSVYDRLGSSEEYDHVKQELDQRIHRLKEELNLL